ncbi:prostamide/prostaglandin F synthase-like isoform X1 [Pieris brassicae]|uniref:prostamide/prostaglandin F synthase-like isoform X1 n=1 Tax=Pieris brassicae TaxID=7116 RepID=UPI001E6605DE|nr:prostamide/prostaglandin F synthase-like isoform X1 [Pieris brassicae]
MALDLTNIGAMKVVSLPGGETLELKNFWQDQNVAIVFFRRWGCIFCRLWAKELDDIARVLKNNNIRFIGVGVEEAGSKEFIDGKYFDGELYYAQDRSIYQKLGFKRFNVVTILTSLLWKQSREAIAKGNKMGLGGDTKGDWVQTGGMLLIEKGGKLINHFKQNGPSDHLSNEEILKCFGLEHEYNAETMANKKREDMECSKRNPKPWLQCLAECPLAPIHMIWAERRCKSSQV